MEPHLNTELRLQMLACSSEPECTVSQSAPGLEDKSGPAACGKASPSRLLSQDGIAIPGLQAPIASEVREVLIEASIGRMLTSCRP